MGSWPLLIGSVVVGWAIGFVMPDVGHDYWEQVIGAVAGLVIGAALFGFKTERKR